MRFTAVVTLLSLAAAPLSAEAPAPLSKSVEVTVTNVDVVVTDRKGNPVTDLGPGDFELKEDGARQILTHIALVDNGPPTAPAPGEPAPTSAGPSAPSVPKVHLVLFLDQLHLTAGNRNRALQSLAEFLPKAVGPRVEAQVVTWDRALQIRGPFTNDGSLLAALLRSLKKETALGDIPARERDALFRQIDSAVRPPSVFARGDSQDYRDMLVPEITSNIRAFCDMRAHDVDATLAAARSSVAALAGVEGRKVLFLLTEGLTPTPGRELWDYFRAAVLSIGSVPGAGSADLSELNFTTYDRRESFNELARIANAASVSLVTIEAGGLTFDTTMSAAFGGTMIRADDAMAKMDAESAMRFLADQTGGAAVVGRNNLATSLSALEAGWTAYYSLGFESTNARPGRERVLSVSVKRPGVVVRSRRSLVERTWEQKIADAVLSGVYLQRTHNPLGASLHVGQPMKSGKVYLVPVEFKIPFENLALIPSGKMARGRILLTVVAGSLDGRTSEISTQRAPIEVPETEVENTEGKPFVYSATLKLKPGAQIVSLALTDEITQITSYVQPSMMIGDADRTGKPRQP
jgi:VWFA-related protein